MGEIIEKARSAALKSCSKIILACEILKMKDKKGKENRILVVSENLLFLYKESKSSLSEDSKFYLTELTEYKIDDEFIEMKFGKSGLKFKSENDDVPIATINEKILRALSSIKSEDELSKLNVKFPNDQFSPKPELSSILARFDYNLKKNKKIIHADSTYKYLKTCFVSTLKQLNFNEKNVHNDKVDSLFEQLFDSLKLYNSMESIIFEKLDKKAEIFPILSQYISQMKQLKHIFINSSQTKKFKEFCESAKKSNLVAITLSGFEMKKEFISQLKNLAQEKNFTSINFIGNIKSDNLVSDFMKSQNSIKLLGLQKLDCMKKMDKLFPLFTNLNSLSLRGCNLSIQSIFESLSKNSSTLLHLRYLDISQNIPDFFRTPDHIPPQLMRLDICEMTWDNIKLSRLLHFIFHRNWHAGLMLNMEKTKLESGTFDESLMLIKNYPLVSLIWDENELSDEFFEFLSHNKNLKYLSFNKCFGPDFDPTIEEEFTTYVPKLKNLQRLSLIGDGTADNSNVIIAFIRSLKENKTLEYLDISNNKLGDKGLTVLKEMIFSSKSLKTVIFDNNEVETSDCFNSFVDSLDLRKPIMAYYPFETIKALVSQKILAKEDAVQLKKRFYGIQGNEFDEINDYVEDIPVKIVSEFSHQFPLYIDDELREIFEMELPENEPEIPVIVEEETEFSETSFVPINNNNADNPNTSPHTQNESENVNKDEDHDDLMSGAEEEKREEKDQEINNDEEKEKSDHEIVSQKNIFDESSSTSSHHNKIIKQKEENKKETGNNLSKVKKSLFDDSSSEEIKGNPKADNTSLHEEEEEEIPEFSKSKQEIKNDDELIQSKENKKSRFDNSSDSSARPPASKKKKFGFDSSSEELVSPKKKKRPQFSDEDEKEKNKSPQNKKKPIFSDSSDEKPNHANKHFSDEEEQDEWPSSSDETNSKQKSKKNDQINSIKKRKSFFSSDDDKLEKPHPQKSSNKQKDILKFSSSESESDPKAKAKSKQNQKHDSDSLKKGKENQKIKKSNNFDDSSESLDSEKLLASSKDKPKLKQKPNSRFDEDDDNSYEEKIMKNKQNPKLVKKNSDDGLENIPKKKISSPNRNNKNIFKNKRIYSGDDDDEIRQDEHVLEITEKIKSKARKLKKSKQNKNSSSSDEKLDSQKKKVSLEKQTSSSESDEKAEYTNSNQKSKNKTSLKRISDMKSSSHKRKKGVFFDDDDDDEIENKNEMKSDKNTKLQNSNNVFLKGDKGSKSRFSDSSDFEEEENIKEQKRVKTNIFSSDEDVFDSKKKKSNSLHKKTSFSKRKDFSGSSDENMSDSNDNIQKFKKKSDKNQQNSKFEKMKVNENKFTSDSEINDLPVKSTNSKKQDFLRKESKEENKRSNAKHKANSRSNDNKSENSSDSESDKIHKKISNKVNSKKIKSSSESENESESDKNIKKSTSNKSKNNIENDTNNLLNAPKRKPANIDEDDDEPPRRRRRRSIPKVEIINEKTTINKTRNPKSYQPTHPNNTTDSDSDSESSSDSENNKDNSFHNKGIKKSRSQNSYPNSNQTNLNNKNRIEKQNPNKNQFNTQQKNQIKKKGQEDQKRKRSRNNEAKIVEIEYHPPSWEDFPLPRIFKGHDTPILRDLEEEFTISSVIHALKHENDKTK